MCTCWPRLTSILLSYRVLELAAVDSGVAERSDVLIRPSALAVPTDKSRGSGEREAKAELVELAS